METAGLTAGDIFLRAATKAAATWRVAAVFTGPLLFAGATLAVAGLADAVLVAAVLAAPAAVVVVVALISIFCATSAAFFFFVGISAFRSLDATVLATAAGLGVETGRVAARGAGFFVGRTAASAIGRRAALAAFGGVLPFADIAFFADVVFDFPPCVAVASTARSSRLFDAPFFDALPFGVTSFAAAAPAAAGRTAFVRGGRVVLDRDFPADLATSGLPAACFDLAGAAAALKEDRDSGLEGFGAGLLFAGDEDFAEAGAFDAGGVFEAGIAAFFDAVALGATSTRRFEAVAAALDFGGMGEPLLGGAVPMAKTKSVAERTDTPAHRLRFVGTSCEKSASTRT